MEWYLTVLKRYAEFNGRSRRKEYWMFSLYNGIVFTVLYVAGLLTLMRTGIAVTFFVLAGLYWLAVIVPALAVSIRRLHDIDKSGWFILICLVPFIGGIALLVMMCLDGTPGDNQYGPNPKALSQAPTIV